MIIKAIDLTIKLQIINKHCNYWIILDIRSKEIYNLVPTI